MVGGGAVMVVVVVVTEPVDVGVRKQADGDPGDGAQSLRDTMLMVILSWLTG